MTKYPKWNRVNVIAWAKETMESGMCQSPTDTKAFKGRGTAQVLRQLVSDVDTVEAEMAALSSATKKVAGAAIYLAEHRRAGVVQVLAGTFPGTRPSPISRNNRRTSVTGTSRPIARHKASTRNTWNCASSHAGFVRPHNAVSHTCLPNPSPAAALFQRPDFATVCLAWCN